MLGAAAPSIENINDLFTNWPLQLSNSGSITDRHLVPAGPAGIGRSPIQPMACRRPSSDYAAHLGTGRPVPFLATTQAYQQTRDQGTRPIGHVPGAPAVHFDVQTAPGASGAVPGALPS